MTDGVDSMTSETGVVENVGVATRISLISLIQSRDMAYFRFIGRHFGFRLSADVEQCWWSGQ